jgi:hypothetical protein
METFTVVIEGTPAAGPARVVDGRVRLLPGRAWDALGRSLAAESDLEEEAARLDRPLAVDLEARAAFLGVSARARAARLASLEAPDFTLPDLEGRLHSLAQHRGQKVFLVAYGSW